MADMHFFGDVRCRVINDNFALGYFADAKTRIVRHLLEQTSEEFVVENQIQKAGASNFDR